MLEDDNSPPSTIWATSPDSPVRQRAWVTNIKRCYISRTDDKGEGGNGYMPVQVRRQYNIVCRTVRLTSSQQAS